MGPVHVCPRGLHGARAPPPRPFVQASRTRNGLLHSTYRPLAEGLAPQAWRRLGPLKRWKLTHGAGKGCATSLLCGPPKRLTGCLLSPSQDWRRGAKPISMMDRAPSPMGSPASLRSTWRDSNPHTPEPQSGARSIGLHVPRERDRTSLSMIYSHLPSPEGPTFRQRGIEPQLPPPKGGVLPLDYRKRYEGSNLGLLG